MVEAELEEASQPKKSKASRSAEAARKRILESYVGKSKESDRGKYADPSALFQ